MNNTFTIDQLIAEVRAVSAKFPNHIYRSPYEEKDSVAACFYNRDKDGKGQLEHGCIFGRALALGIGRRAS